MHDFSDSVFLQILDFFALCCTPVMLLVCGLILSGTIRIHRLLHPVRFWKTLGDIPPESRTTPMKAVTMALAGTLGVGNITGVSAAILQGGTGAVFWMWAGALFSMAVKYGEVALAVMYRKKTTAGKWYGGMMYVIRDGLGKRLSQGAAWLSGGIFAVLCLLNSLITGNIVQSNAAADVLHPLPEWMGGLLLTGLTAAALAYGIGKVGDITLRLVPGMTLVFILLSLWIILGNLELIPSILREIVSNAFSLPALGGGITGLGCRAFFHHLSRHGLVPSLRYGITRGIFSNEAGCGTSPCAHASADTKSPYHQGCWGIFEVICDTLILCTMTALVICIGDRRYGILSSADENLSLRAFQVFGGNWVYGIMAGMVAVFAYATILAQMYYGSTAIGYFTKAKLPQVLYSLLALFCVFAGAVMEPGIMWRLADGIVCIMTCLNTMVLLLLRREIRDTVDQPDCSSNRIC